ncbi:MAG TPA: helix-turn-helix domain-containing protein [Methylovirgula sp.]|jgi:DNA-binding HxlR family transcriptional regulator|nr:helix-turn-helix domain-containing protein [Methylovirgula sp.]
MTAKPLQEGTFLEQRHSHVTADGGYRSENCEKVSGILARIGDKWSVLVVMLLGDGPLRFNELKRKIGGISQRMLTLTLRGLERDGLVKRTVYATIPPRVEYQLTDLGRSLQEPVRNLGLWALSNGKEIDAARKTFDEKRSAD